MKQQLSTDVRKYLRGIGSWDNAGADTQEAFLREMHGRSYGYDATLDAWAWFLAGWSCKPDVTPESGRVSELEKMLRT